MVMKVAMPISRGRISPVFDVAKRLLVADIEDGAEANRYELAIDEAELTRRAMQVVNCDVDVLICAAISKPLEVSLVSAGIQVTSHTCGNVEDVLAAYASGQLTEQAFLMPGCCGRRRRGRPGQSRRGRRNSSRVGR